MFAQLNLYALIALIIAVVVLSTGWYVSHRISSAEIDTLTQRNATLTSAIETNEKTIAQMVIDAQVLAAANTKLTTSIMAAEMASATAWQSIDALDLESGVDDPTGLETRVNEAFAASIERLRMATNR
ncbi:hypothetical protein [Rhizobium sp.]|uniref:hypothetical protein n=1 Tax=Rhizobium sp. TaxID=391 RepID=UPI0028AF61D0